MIQYQVEHFSIYRLVPAIVPNWLKLRKKQVKIKFKIFGPTPKNNNKLKTQKIASKMRTIKIFKNWAKWQENVSENIFWIFVTPPKLGTQKIGHK